MIRSDKCEKGSVLIIVLVLMMVSMSLALYAVSLSRDMVSTSQQLLDGLQAKIEASSAMEKTIYIGATCHFSNWNIDNMTANRDFPVQLNLRSNPFMAGNSQIRLQDSAGRLNLQTNPQFLREILHQKGIKQGEVETAVDSLLDWVDDDDLKHLNGAESYYYRAEQSKKYLPRNDSYIQSVFELALIKGWRGVVFDALRDEILPTATGMININTADAALLSGALDISLKSAEQLIQNREKTGILRQSDIIALVPNALTKMFEYNTNFPSRTVLLDIRTNIRASGDYKRAIINFNATKDRPYTIETYEE